MPKSKIRGGDSSSKRSTGAAASTIGGSVPVLSDDIAALLNSKIKEFEQNQAEENEKSQKALKGRSKAAAKTKLKEAKQLLADTSVVDSVKVQKLLAQLEAEHEQVLQVFSEQQKSRQELFDTEKERDACQVELSGKLALKSKIEALFKELQQQTTALLDERRRLSEMERQRRQELADEFQNKISGVKVTMDDQAQERLELARENEDLRSRFKKFFEQYDAREKDRLEHQQTRELEVKVLESKLTETVQVYRQEATKEALATRENEELVQADQSLRSQLQTYTTKYSQFQGSLQRSDKVLGQYQRQRNKLERRVETLEKENVELRLRNERKLATLVKEKEGLAKGKEKLQERCKKLQAERQKLLQDVAMTTGQNGGG